MSPTKAQLQTELDDLRKLSVTNGEGPMPEPARERPIALTVFALLADIAVILVALVFLFRMWLT